MKNTLDNFFTNLIAGGLTCLTLAAMLKIFFLIG